MKNGRLWGELGNVKDAIKHLTPMHSKTLVADFGSAELRTVRQQMIGVNLCRNVMNARVIRIR